MVVVANASATFDTDAAMVADSNSAVLVETFILVLFDCNN